MMPPAFPVRPQLMAALPAAVLLVFFSATAGLAQGPSGSRSNDGLGPLAQPVHDSELPAGDGSGDVIGGPQSELRYDIRTEDVPFTDRQISYEVRYAKIGASAWRDRLKDRFTPVAIEGETTEAAWVLDQEQIHALMELLQADIHANVLMLPKPTAFEGSRVTVEQTYEQYYVADVELIRQADSLALQPNIQPLTLGMTIELSGMIHPGATQLALDLRDKQLEAIHDLSRTAESPEGPITAPYQIPSTKDRYYRLSCSIPEGSALMLSLGIQERPRRPLSGLTKVVAELLEANASPSLEVKVRGEPVEHFILITPRRVVLGDQQAQAAR